MEKKMFDSGKKPEGCGSADTLVAYLYGELGKDERDGFELHLQECDGCASELASFSALRISIADLKGNEPLMKGEVSRVDPSASWIQGIRELLVSLAGVRTFAGAAAAVLLIFFALYLFGGLPWKDSEVDVATESTPGAVSPSPSAERKVPEVASRDAEETESPSAKPDPGSAEYPVRAATTRSKRPVSRRDRQTRPSGQVAEASEPPRLSEAASEDIEDDSLRLTDLFSDLSED